MIVQPDSAMTKIIEYFAEEMGKFDTYIAYVINDNHPFQLYITANIVRKELYIDEEELELGKEWLREESYRPMISAIPITNKLSMKTSFR